jgi:RecA-family ATPase
MTSPATEVRQQLRRNGYAPIPLNGKVPSPKGWEQKLETNAGEIDFWATVYPHALNTGILCRFNPCCDIDILNQEAAEAVEALVRERFEDGGHILVRIGKAPKRAIPFRTQEPFGKMVVLLIAPNGEEHKIEFLGDGQQVVVNGIHPEGTPYTWFGKSLLDVPHDELPYIRAAEARQLIHDAAELLVAGHNYTRAKRVTNGGDGPREAGEPQASAERIAAALAVIPNNSEDWDGWNNIGMATWRATGGSEAGLAAFDAWSRKSAKHDADTTAARWAHYFNSPPSHIGAGTIFHLATEAAPGWSLDYQAQINPPPPQPPPPEPEPKAAPKSEPPPKSDELSFVDVAAWQGQPEPPQEWLALRRIPHENVTLLGGDGATGKTTIALQLCVATVTDKEWLGLRIERPGPVIFYSAEESPKDLHRRLAAVLRHYQVDYNAVAQRFFPHCFCPDQDPTLARLDRAGVLQPTTNFARLQQSVRRIRPQLVCIEAAADVYAGNESDRNGVGSFIRLLRGLAMECETAVVLLQHPSVAGLLSGRGTSGSTQWNNSVRSRLYLATVRSHEEAEPATDLRKLEVMKSNFGRAGEIINLRWRDGIFDIVPGEGSIEKVAADTAADDLFLTLLRRFTEQGRHVIDKPCGTYAPTVFAEEPAAKAAKVGKDTLADAMRRLFTAGKITVLTEGRPSKRRSRLVEPGRYSAQILPFERPPSDRPDERPTPPNAAQGAGVTTLSPLPLSALGGGAQAGAQRPAPPPTQKQENTRATVTRFRVMGTCPAETPCLHCRQTGDVKRITNAAEVGGKSETLHEDCAAAWFEKING